MVASAKPLLFTMEKSINLYEKSTTFLIQKSKGSSLVKTANKRPPTKNLYFLFAPSHLCNVMQCWCHAFLGCVNCLIFRQNGVLLDLQIRWNCCLNHIVFLCVSDHGARVLVENFFKNSLKYLIYGWSDSQKDFEKSVNHQKIAMSF